MSNTPSKAQALAAINMAHFASPADFDTVQEFIEGAPDAAPAGEPAAIPSNEQLHEVLRSTGYLTNGQARECAELVRKLMESPCK